MNPEIALVNQHLCSLPDEKLLSQEVCGVVSDGRVLEFKNINPNPHEAFEFDLSWWPVVEAASLIWHTHINNMDVLSFDDLDMCKHWGLPIYMFNVETGKSDYYDPWAVQPYEGRPWAWSHSNCWELYKDFAQRELGLKLGEHRLPADGSWQSDQWNQWLEELPQEGFVLQPRTAQKQIDYANIRRGDLLLFKIGRTHNPNHCAAMYSLEENEILHHLTGGLSRVVPLDQAWRNRIHSVWRHRDVAKG